MINVLVIFLILSWTNNSLQQDFDIDGRIVGGYQMDITTRKFQVSVLPGGYMCGGSLVQLNWVVTAAHCIAGFTSQQINVYAGSNTFAAGVMRKVSSLFQQPNFNPYTISSDIALLKLTTPFVAGPTIGTVILATSLPLVGASLTVSGYGTISSGGNVAPYLLGANVQMISFYNCNQSYGETLLAGMFCAAATGKDTCQGDSGGPITYNGNLVGVISFGYGCAEAAYPGVYTSIPYFKLWITTTIALNS